MLQHGYHIALGGSVLHKGFSTKDVDIFIYPHSNSSKGRKKQSTIFKLLEGIGYKKVRKFVFHKYDKKIVYHMEYKNKRVDIFFVK